MLCKPFYPLLRVHIIKLVNHGYLQMVPLQIPEEHIVFDSSGI